jgi:aminopeptidase N
VELAQQLLPYDPAVARRARKAVRVSAAKALRAELEHAYARMTGTKTAYSPDAGSAARRALRNACLGLLAELGPEVGGKLAEAQLAGSDNLTDRLAALAALDVSGSAALEPALAALYDRWKAKPLALDKWFGAQARSTRPDALERVAKLLQHPDYDGKTPNRVRSVLGVFAVMNPVAFHDADGRGHRLFTDQVLEVDKRNPALSARLFGAFEIWPRLEPKRRESAKASLQRAKAAEGVSKNLYEIAARALEAKVEA